MNHLLHIAESSREPVTVDLVSHRRINRFLQEFLRTDLADDPRYREAIALAGVSIRANLLEKWEETKNAYYLRLNPPTATLCPLDGPDVGRLETIGLKQFLEVIAPQHAKIG